MRGISLVSQIFRRLVSGLRALVRCAIHCHCADGRNRGGDANGWPLYMLEEVLPLHISPLFKLPPLRPYQRQVPKSTGNAVGWSCKPVHFAPRPRGLGFATSSATPHVSNGIPTMIKTTAMSWSQLPAENFHLQGPIESISVQHCIFSPRLSIYIVT